MKFIVLFALIAFALADLQDDANCLQYTWTDASGDEWIVDASSANYQIDQVYEDWFMYVEGDNTYWFTLSSCATESYPCPEGANACVLNSELGTTTVIGRFDQITETFDSGVSIVSVGDGCSKTSINLLCNESLTYNVSVEAEGCYTVINFSSDSVCPSYVNNLIGDDGDWGYWNDKNRGIVMFAIIFSLIVTGICACLLITMFIVCCYKACTDKKYKKREDVMLENTKGAFQPVPTQEPAVPMVRFAPVSPLHPMSQLPQQYQYIQQPMYFHPIAPQSQPAQIGQHTAVQVDEDEKLARKLQAELNAN